MSRHTDPAAALDAALDAAPGLPLRGEGFDVLTSERVLSRIDREPSPRVFVEELLRVELPGEQGGLALLRRVLPPEQVARLGGLRGAILLIHGFAQNLHTWHLPERSIPNYLAALGYDVFCVDLRGRGLSHRAFGAPLPTHPDDYILRDIPAAARALLRRSPCDDLIVMGHSLGGAVSYGAAPALRAQGVLRGVATFAGVFGLARLPKGLLHQACRLGVMLDRLALPSGLTVPLPALTRAFLLPAAHLLNHPLARALPFHGWAPGSTDPDIIRSQLTHAMDHVAVANTLAVARWGIDGAFSSRDGHDYVLAFRDASAGLPLLVLAASDDRVVTPEDAEYATWWADPAHVEYHCLGPEHGGNEWGHLDILLGDQAPAHAWPRVARWLDRIDPGTRWHLDG